ncbi:MAG: metal-dependent hydrolase [Planctomycetota bacterium]
MAIQLTWLGHATWMIQIGEHRIILDPFLNDNPAATLPPSEIKADYVLISHGHFDHVTDAAEIANQNDATIIAVFEIASWFAENHGVKNTIGMNIGGSTKTNFGAVKMTPAIHSSQLPDGSSGGCPGGFVLMAENKKIYFACDTALFSDMALIGKMGIDVAVLPIGDLFTMGIEDSIEAIKFINPKKVIPTHYNTWPPIEQDASSWAEKVKSETNAEPMTPNVGDSFEL